MSREREIVEVFRDLVSNNKPFTAEYLNLSWQPADYRGTQDLSHPSRMATVRGVLRTLEALGLIDRTSNGQFHATDSQRAHVDPLPVHGTVEGPPAGPPPQGGDGQGGGQGGDGFREVLSHPHLFALLPSDFERLLETIG